MTREWTLAQSVGPSQLPVTVEKAKQKLRLRLNGTAHDDELTRQIAAATSQFMEDTDRAVITADFVQQYHGFPPGNGIFQLYVKPVQSVQSISYTDENGDPQTIDPATYRFNAASRTVALAPAPGENWPTTDQGWFGVTLTYRAGYGDPANVDSNIIEAILCLTAALFYGNSPDAQPYMDAYERLIAPKKRTSYV